GERPGSADRGADMKAWMAALVGGALALAAASAGARDMAGWPDVRIASLAAPELDHAFAGGRPAHPPAHPGDPLRAPAGPAIRYDAGWIDARPEPEGGAEFQCLAEALYFE